MNDLSAEQEAEQERITVIGRLERDRSVEEGPKYQFRERKPSESREDEDKSGWSVYGRKTMNGKIQPPAKRAIITDSTK